MPGWSRLRRRCSEDAVSANRKSSVAMWHPEYEFEWCKADPLGGSLYVSQIRDSDRAEKGQGQVQVLPRNRPAAGRLAQRGGARQNLLTELNLRPQSKKQPQLC